MTAVLDRGHLRQVAGAFVGTFALLSLFAWSGHLPVDNDASYADVARQMLKSGDWLNPLIHGVPFLDKPPLYYWLVAIAQACFGDSIFVLRLPSIASGAGCAALVYWASRSGREALAGVTGVLLLLAMPIYFEYSRRVYMEVPIALSSFGAMLAFARAGQALRDGRADVAAFVWAGGLTGVAFMIKSLVGLLPAVGFSVWLLAVAFRARPRLGQVLTGGAVSVASLLAVAAPWHVYQLLTNREVFLDFTWELHVEEQLLAAQPWSAEPAWFYLAEMFGGDPLMGLCAAGGLVACAIALRQRRLETLDGLLAVTTLVGLVVLSASETKKDLYLIPLAPLFATMAARGLFASVRSQVVLRAVTIAAALALLRQAPLLDPAGEAVQGASVLVPAARAVRDSTAADETVHLVDVYFAAMQYYSERRVVSEWTSPGPPRMTGHIPYIMHGRNMRYLPPQELASRVVDGDVWVLLPATAERVLAGVTRPVQVLHEGVLVVVRRR